MVNLVLVMESGAKPMTQEGQTLLPFFWWVGCPCIPTQTIYISYKCNFVN